MKATKTRTLLSKLIKQNREIQIGEPVTDWDINKVSDELDSLEKKNKIMTWSICILIIISIVLFLN
jgi:hypothetical protein